ncbi:MAG: bis(5'-nucleosyl)-tetraphosphatase (symmetrical) [Comamonadaceae bacterium CG1_02_60_18]|nr:MAG: bis(5'-nucleosyl)-tetraphosphatase (symmetrical) [Comamonadaceae bacterium CG1_02_60_18]PIQ52607.1 MAG: bis(5'-nucleosyl)-tetraphosphatase (symmetrical) [Comamonadaceae bacterium CG12_big_fil_rev_8_21_14_0_65_59_15]
MALYLIGDLQGCDGALKHLLDKLAFSPSRDTLYFLGDLVNRGPDSAGVLRRLMAYGASAQCLLGNHDLHLLAVAHGARKPGRHDTLQDVLQATDRPALLEWLRQQPLARLLDLQDHYYLLVHAGVLPAWSATKTMALADEVAAVLRSADLPDLLHQMYGNAPDAWDDNLTGKKRLRVIINTLTRLRFCSASGQMDLSLSDSPNATPEGLMPWFDVPGRQSADVTVAFGHWSTLGLLERDNLLALDTGCVWGGCLSAARLPTQPGDRGYEIIQVSCPQAQKPGP